jgi:hypothetical protein
MWIILLYFLENKLDTF